jgi:hypothetical protein
MDFRTTANAVWQTANLLCLPGTLMRNSTRGRYLLVLLWVDPAEGKYAHPTIFVPKNRTTS